MTLEETLKLANQGNADAQGFLGDCYRKGDGVEQDFTKAADYYTKAAEQGHAQAQCILGNCYYLG